IFKNLLSQGKTTNNIRKYFVDISTRMGLFDAAETHLRTAYSNASDKRLKLALLNNLFNVLLSSGKKPKELLRIVNQFGELADPESEEEEGHFLQMILISTAREDLEVEDKIVED